MRANEIYKASWLGLLLFLNTYGLMSCSFKKNIVKTASSDQRKHDETDNTSVNGYIYVSWGDQIMVGSGDLKLDKRDKIDRVLKSWKTTYNASNIFWRASSEYINRFYERNIESEDAFTKSYYKEVAKISKEFNVFRYVRQQTRINGQQFYLYMTFLDHGAPKTQIYGGTMPFPWQDRYTLQHPDMQVVDRKGNYQYGVLEMAYPQNRKVMIGRFLRFINDYDADGIYVCTRTHSMPAEHGDQFGFSEPIVKSFKQKYNIDILRDERFNYKNVSYNLKDPMVEEWRKMRGEYLTQFYRELRQAIPKNKKIIAGIPRGRYLGFPYGNLYLEWETLIKEKLVDGIVLGISTGNWHYPQMNNIKARDRGYLCSEFENDLSQSFNIPSVDESIIQYASLCKQYEVDFAYKNIPYKSSNMWENQSHFKDLNALLLDCPSASIGGIMKVPHTQLLDFSKTSMSVEAYINPRSYSGRILSKYAHPESTKRGWEWVLNPDGIFQFRMNQVSGKDNIFLSKTKINLNRWTHVATVVDIEAGEVRVYIDGKLDNTYSIDKVGVRNNPDVDLNIGRYGGSNSNIFEGKIDELRISRIARHLKGIPPPYSSGDPEPVAVFKFDKIVDNMVEDATGKISAKLVFPNNEPPLTESLNGFGKALYIKK